MGFSGLSRCSWRNGDPKNFWFLEVGYFLTQSHVSGDLSCFCTMGSVIFVAVWFV